jgi:carbon-monoxide dehydrogenase medium subunit
VKPAPFAYLAPRSIDEALAQLAEHGTEARPLAGGQSLVRLMNTRVATPSVIIDLNRIPHQDHIDGDGDGVRIGALARQRDAELSPAVRTRIPLFAEAGAQVAHAAVRQRGTVVGSIAFADPAAELPAALLALDGQVLARRAGGERVIEAADFFTGPFRTGLAPDELAVELRIPVTPTARTGSAFVEMSRRHGELPVCGVGSVLRLAQDGTVASVRIALCGVGPHPLRARAAEAALTGAEPTAANLADAAELAAEGTDPTGDCHGSAGFRRHLAGVLTRRSLTTAAARARRSAPSAEELTGA